MTGGNIVRLLALVGLLSLTGCRAWCERNYAPQSYYPNNYSGCAPQPCCAPASNYPMQPCAPAPGWNTVPPPR